MTAREDILHEALDRAITDLTLIYHGNEIPIWGPSNLEVFKATLSKLESTPEDVVIPREVVETVSQDWPLLVISDVRGIRASIGGITSGWRLNIQLALNALAEK
jgi:hypothetical protein